MQVLFLLCGSRGIIALSSLVVILRTIDLSYSSSLIRFSGARGVYGGISLFKAMNSLHRQTINRSIISGSCLLYIFSLVCDERTDGYYAIAILSEVLAFLKTIPGAPQEVVLWPVVGQYAHEFRRNINYLLSLEIIIKSGHASL